MSRSRLLLLAATAAVAAAILGAAPAHAEDARVTAVVALGDSAASGEGAGDYVPGTRGERGDWCHRSPRAWVHGTGLTGRPVNLACSGATSADVAFGAAHHFTEPSQAQQLVDVARRFRVTTVVLQVGANDDVALSAVGTACIAAFLDPAIPACRRMLGPLLAGRLAATAAAVERAVRDVQAAIGRAGYSERSYALVLASYAAPMTENAVPLAAARGCPYSRADARWGRTVLFPALSAALHGVADRTGARFLDLTRAAEGHEACSRGSAAPEWQRRLTVDPAALVRGGLDAVGFHLAQESFHPAATGHAEMGRCIGDFVRSRAAAGTCVTGADGHAHLGPDMIGPAAPAPAPV